MPRHLLILDAETFYDDKFSLRQMTPAEYILSPKFEVIMWATKHNGGPHTIVDGPDFPRWLKQFPPQDTAVVTFNALFDCSILAWKYGYIPSLMIDAMGMARALDGHRFRKFSLAAIAEQLGFPPKGDAIHNAKGKRRHHFSPEEFKEFCAYAIRDNEICEKIFLHYYDHMPKSELKLMDMTLRACIEPTFVANTKLLEDHLTATLDRKEKLKRAADNVDPKLLLSTVKFRQALIDAGFPEDEIETKVSLTTGKEVPAFAKTDAFMERLLNDPNPAVAALAAARIGIRSTLEETRTRKFISIANLEWPKWLGLMPVPLRYGGAHTHRLSGDWGLNLQNLPRGSKLRDSLEAPKGSKVLTIDLGQIEARLVAWISGCNKLLEEFARYDAGDKTYDPYNRLGTAIFGRPVDRKASDPIQQAMGFIGKTGILGLGYGCGRDKFDTMVVTGARTMGVDISAIYSQEITHNAVTIYRDRYGEIQKCWRYLQRLVSDVLGKPSAAPVRFGPVMVSPGKVLLPSGLHLHYSNLEAKETLADWKKDGSPPEPRTEYTYIYGGAPQRIYGPKLLENICQALGRVIVMDAALRIKKETGFRFVHQAHDELVYVIPDAELDAMRHIIHSQMITPPVWGHDLPLVADVGVGKSYGEAK